MKYLIHLLSLETPEAKQAYIRSLNYKEYEALMSEIIEFQQTFMEIIVVGMINYGPKEIKEVIKTLGDMLSI